MPSERGLQPGPGLWGIVQCRQRRYRALNACMGMSHAKQDTRSHCEASAETGRELQLARHL